MASRTALVPQARADLLRQRALRNGWLCVVAGLIIPFIALWGAAIGWAWRKSEGSAPAALMFAGVAVFGVRLALYIS